MVGRIFSTFAITGGSMPEGKEGTLSTEFFTSANTTSTFLPFSTSTVIVAEFSLETEVTRSTPTVPFKLSSIFRTTPSSISCGDAPGYTKLMVMMRESTKGKKEDFMESAPIIPNPIKAIIITLTATWYFIK